MLTLLGVICALPLLWVIMSLFPLRRDKCIGDMRHARIMRR
jgi:hypothetical protein